MFAKNLLLLYISYVKDEPELNDTSTFYTVLNFGTLKSGFRLDVTGMKDYPRHPFNVNLRKFRTSKKIG